MSASGPCGSGGPALGQRVVLVSGLSGAGKASVLRALEDLGFEAVDNPPLPMLEELVRRAAAAGGRRLAIGVDIRTQGFDCGAVLSTLARLRCDPTLRLELVFVWADETVLQRRFTETRRRHPMAESGRVQDGIEAERMLTAPLREAADHVIDTSDLPLADLRRLVEQYYGGSAAPRAGFSVTLVSFAFPAGLPREADMVFDARFLRNPHYVSALRPLTGLDDAVGRYVESDADFPAFLDRVRALLDFVLPRFVREGKKYCTVAVGCTGGRHRSVYIVRLLAEHLDRADWRVSVVHRELAGPEAPMVGGFRGGAPVAALRAQEA
jgi:UPF0042 nucleotide-binding protein